MKKLIYLGIAAALGFAFLAKKAVSATYQTGIASWYGPGYEGNQTANQEIFDPQKLTAAHRKLPFNTRVRVTDLDTDKNVIVRINDRGPYVDGRIIDLSERAAEVLGMKHKGLAKVRLEIVN